jgi:hypothetical protein
MQEFPGGRDGLAIDNADQIAAKAEHASRLLFQLAGNIFPMPGKQDWNVRQRSL